MPQSLTTADIGPLEVYRGDTLVFTAPVRRADAAVNLTGMTAATCRVATACGTTPVFSLTLAGGEITNAAPTTGVLTVTASTTNTALLTGSTYLVDLEIAESSGRVTTVWRGLLNVKDPVG